MGEDLTKQTEQEPKRERKPFFQLADDELNITHDGKQLIHRVVFKTKSGETRISVNTSVFFKLKSKIKNWNNDNPLNFWKNNSYTLGLSKHGKIIIYVKSDLKVFPKEFLRSLRKDFKLVGHEIRWLIEQLDFVSLEISHKINDPDKKLENAKVKYNLDGLIERLIAFTDKSPDHKGTLEFELLGDPETSTNLEFLLRDKLHAILFFAELTKIVKKLTEIQDELFNSVKYISNALTFILDDLLNERLNKTKQNEVE